MDRRTKHSDEKLTPTLSIGGKKPGADPSGWKPKRRGDGVYHLKDGSLKRKKRTLKFKFEDEGTQKLQSSKAILIFGGLTALALIFVAFWFFSKRAKPVAEPMAKATNSSPVFEVSEAEMGALSAKDWKGALPLQIATAFVRAATHAERLRLVRNPDSNAEILADFFESGPGAHQKLSTLVPIRSINTDEMASEEFRADFVDGSNRVVCVVLENDAAKVDFKCYSRHGSVDFGKLLDGSAARADEVRLIVSGSEPYYNFAFSDDRQWTSFNAQSPDLPADLLLYARIGSAAEREIKEAVKSGSALLTLALESREESHKQRQFEVTQVWARSWVETWKSPANGSD